LNYYEIIIQFENGNICNIKFTLFFFFLKKKKSHEIILINLNNNFNCSFKIMKRSSDELAAYQKKLIRIDDHMGIAIAGLTSDARVLR